MDIQGLEEPSFGAGRLKNKRFGGPRCRCGNSRLGKAGLHIFLSVIVVNQAGTCSVKS